MAETGVDPAPDDARLAARRRRAQPRPRAARPRALRVGRRLPRRETGRCPPSTTRSACSCTARWRPPSWRGTRPPPRADVFAAKGLLEAVLRRCASEAVLRARRRARSCTPAGPARVLVDGESVGFLGEVHPLVAAALGLRRAGRHVRDRPRARRRARAAGRGYADLDELPVACAATWRFPCPPACPAAEVVARRARPAGGELLDDVEVFDVYAGEQAGEGRRSIALHLGFRAPDRTLTDEEVSERMEADPAPTRTGPAGGRRRVPELTAIVAGASGYTGALAAALLQRHEAIELVGVTSRSDAGRRLDDLYPQHRVPLVLDAFDAEDHDRDRRGDRRLPARRRRARRRRAARARREASWTSAPTSACATRPPTPTGTASTARPSLLRRGRLRAARAAARRDRAAPTSSPTPAATRRRRCWRSRRWRARACSPTSSIDAKSGVSGAGRARDRDDALRLGQRERDALRRRAPPPHARDRAGAARARARPTRSCPRSRRTCCRSTRASWCPATSRRPSRSTADAAGRALRPGPTRDEPFVELAERPPGVRDVRDIERLPHPRPRRRAHGQGLRVRGDRQPLEGRRVAGGAEPQPHVRPRRDARASRERALLPLALGRAVHDAVTEAPDRTLPQGFRAAGVAAGLKPSGAPDLGAAGLRRARDDERRALHALGRPGRAGARLPGATRGWTRCASSWPTRATRTARPAAAGSTTAIKMQGAAAMAGRVDPDRVAVASTGVIGVPLDTGKVMRGLSRAGRRAAARRRRRPRGGDPHHRRVPQARLPRRGAARRARAPERAGQGRRDDPAELRDDAVLRADRRRAAAPRPPTCCSASASSAPSTASPSTASSRRTTRRSSWPAARAASRSSPRREAEAIFGAGARRAAAPARAGHGARRRGRQAHGARRGARRRSEPASSASPARWPTRRWSRPPCTAATRTGAGSPRPSAMALPGAAPLAFDVGDRGRAGLLGRRRGAPRRRRGWPSAVAGDEVEYEIGLPGEGAETEVFFSDLGHGYVSVNAEYTT